MKQSWFHDCIILFIIIIIIDYFKAFFFHAKLVECKTPANYNLSLQSKK